MHLSSRRFDVVAGAFGSDDPRLQVVQLVHFGVRIALANRSASAVLVVKGPTRSLVRIVRIKQVRVDDNRIIFERLRLGHTFQHVVR